MKGLDTHTRAAAMFHATSNADEHGLPSTDAMQRPSMAEQGMTCPKQIRTPNLLLNRRKTHLRSAATFTCDPPTAYHSEPATGTAQIISRHEQPLATERTRPPLHALTAHPSTGRRSYVSEPGRAPPREARAPHASAVTGSGLQGLVLTSLRRFSDEGRKFTAFDNAHAKGGLDWRTSCVENDTGGQMHALSCRPDLVLKACGFRAGKLSAGLFGLSPLPEGLVARDMEDMHSRGILSRLGRSPSRGFGGIGFSVAWASIRDVDPRGNNTLGSNAFSYLIISNTPIDASLADRTKTKRLL
ncbi:hypothetical protein MMC27_004391 [Xylographa pallens]|nr:hypothetical protein [Xylographa pallens]